MFSEETRANISVVAMSRLFASREETGRRLTRIFELSTRCRATGQRRRERPAISRRRFVWTSAVGFSLVAHRSGGGRPSRRRPTDHRPRPSNSAAARPRRRLAATPAGHGRAPRRPRRKRAGARNRRRATASLGPVFFSPADARRFSFWRVPADQTPPLGSLPFPANQRRVRQCSLFRFVFLPIDCASNDIFPGWWVSVNVEGEKNDGEATFPSKRHREKTNGDAIAAPTSQCTTFFVRGIENRRTALFPTNELCGF